MTAMLKTLLSLPRILRTKVVASQSAPKILTKHQSNFHIFVLFLGFSQVFSVNYIPVFITLLATNNTLMDVSIRRRDIQSYYSLHLVLALRAGIRWR